MFSASALSGQTALAFGNNNFVVGGHTKPIAMMDQAEKVNLATQIADGEISSGDIEKLCADPDFTSEFLNNAEVQPILLTAVLQGRDIGDAVVQAMKEPTCTPCIEPNIQTNIMSYVSHWLSALQDQPEMTFAIKFFEDITSKRAIIDAIGMNAIKNAPAGAINDTDPCYLPVFQYREKLLQDQASILQRKIDEGSAWLVDSAANIMPRKTQLLTMDPSDPETIKFQEKLDADRATHNLKYDELDAVKNESMTLLFELMFLKQTIDQLGSAEKN